MVLKCDINSHRFQHIPKPCFHPLSLPCFHPLSLPLRHLSGYIVRQARGTILVKRKRVICAELFSSPGSWCSCVNIQRERIVMTVAGQSCGGWTTLFSSDPALFCDFRSTRVAMKIEARKAEWMPEMEAELAFPLSTKELFVIQDAGAHLGDGKFWSCEACLLLSR